MNKIMQWFTAVLTCLVFTYAHAQTGDMQALAGAMKQGGYVIVRSIRANSIARWRQGS